MLCQHLKRELCEIELVESEELGTIGVGESTVPPFVGLIQRLGIDEPNSSSATDATYKLGIKFVGWHERSDSYFHPFGVIGKPIGNHDFYQCWLKARAEGDTSALQDFSPCNVMAEQGRFFHPAKARNTPIGGANYALHVDALLVTKFLRKYAEERGAASAPRASVVEVGAARGRFHRSRDARQRRRGARRLLHRLHRLSRHAHRQDAGRRARRLVKLPALRSRHRLQDREQGPAACRTRAPRRSRPAGAGAFRCSSASARAMCIPAASRATRRRKPRCCARSTRPVSKSRASFPTSPDIAASSGSTTACRWACRPDSSSRSRPRRST